MSVRSPFNGDNPSVITSETYNDAEIIFNMLQNKEKLVSFLDCTTLLRGMGMNPTQEDMDHMKELMAEPIVRLEQWRREEELRREKERRKEEARERKSKARISVAPSKKKSLAEKAIVAAQDEKAVKIIPAEEIKNIDWNIFISCAEMIFRDCMREEKAVYDALKIFNDDERPLQMTREQLIQIVTSNGDNVLSTAEVKLLASAIPETCSFKELASRIQGTYVPPTQEELDRQAMKEIEARRQRENAEKPAEPDLLDGL